LYYSL
jgi:hypothetical protein